MQLAKLAFISTVMIGANAADDKLSKDEVAEMLANGDAKGLAEHMDVTNGKTQKQLDIEAYHRSIGEEPPTGDLPTITKPEEDYTDGHQDDPYWNYETGEDDDAYYLEDRPWYWMFKQVRYVVYFCVVAVPWTLFGAALVATNVVINIAFNDGWAGGNIFLIAQTAYLVLQYVLSVLLFLEIDPWLKYMKFIRIGSLFVSYLYTIMYIIFSILLVVILDDLDGSEITYMNMYTVMVLSYNLIFHTPVLAINIGIILKEISMEFIQFMNDVAMTGMDDYSLATHNLLDLFQDLFNWINPWWWAEAVEEPEMWDDMYE